MPNVASVGERVGINPEWEWSAHAGEDRTTWRSALPTRRGKN
jgi:hypothetical protein